MAAEPLPLLTVRGSDFDGPTILALLRRDVPMNFSNEELFMLALRDHFWELPSELYPKARFDLHLFLEGCYMPVYLKTAVERTMAAGK